MVLNTHLQLNESLNGDLVELKEGYSKISLQSDEKMVADEKGLIHGGFIFCAADYAAMACVNHPNVVLAKSEVKFLAPVRLGEKVIFEARKLNKDNHKVSVEVVGKVNNEQVFLGQFFTVILSKHVLDI